MKCCLYGTAICLGNDDGKLVGSSCDQLYQASLNGVGPGVAAQASMTTCSVSAYKLRNSRILHTSIPFYEPPSYLWSLYNCRSGPIRSEDAVITVPVNVGYHLSVGMTFADPLSNGVMLRSYLEHPEFDNIEKVLRMEMVQRLV